MQNCQTFKNERQTLSERICQVAKKSSNISNLNGARGRNRTTDTRIFNPLLYP